MSSACDLYREENSSGSQEYTYVDIFSWLSHIIKRDQRRNPETNLPQTPQHANAENIVVISRELFYCFVHHGARNSFPQSLGWKADQKQNIKTQNTAIIHASRYRFSTYIITVAIGSVVVDLFLHQKTDFVGWNRVSTITQNVWIKLSVN